MLTRAKRRVLFWFSVVLFFLLMPVAVLYALGYRLDSNFSLKKTGGLYVASDVSGSEIFINSQFQKKTNLLQGGVFVQNLKPGRYQILVANESYLPWQKELEVKSQLVSEARALLVPREPNAEVLLRGRFLQMEFSPLDRVLLLAEDKDAAKQLVWYLPEDREFLLSDPALGVLKFKKSFELVRWLPRGAVLKLDGKPVKLAFDMNERLVKSAGLGEEKLERSREESDKFLKRSDTRASSEVFYDSEKKILAARWLRAEIPPYYFSKNEEVLLENKEMRGFEYYPRRRDAVIAAFDNGLWAVEFDGRGGRIIQPLYKGKKPVFATFPGEGELYVLDDGILIRLLLSSSG